MERSEINILYWGPLRHSSYQVSVHLVKWFQRRIFFRNQPIRSNNCLSRPCLITDRSEMGDLDRGPPKDGSYQVWFICPCDFRGEDCFRNQPIREKNCHWQPCLLTDRDEMSNLYSGSSIDASDQVSVQLAMQFQRRLFFRIQPIRNKNCLWRPCLLTDQDEKSNLYRNLHRCFLSSFGSFGHVVSEENIFQNWPIRNKNCLWWPCLLTDWDEMSSHYRGPSIDASCQVSVPLAMWFQRRRLKRKSPNQKTELPVANMFVSGSWRNEQSV